MQGVFSHQVYCKNAGEQELNQCHIRWLVSGEQPSEKIHAMEQCCQVGEKYSHQVKQESRNDKGEQRRRTAWHKSSNKDKKENRIKKTNILDVNIQEIKTHAEMSTYMKN